MEKTEGNIKEQIPAIVSIFAQADSTDRVQSREKWSGFKCAEPADGVMDDGEPDLKLEKQSDGQHEDAE